MYVCVAGICAFLCYFMKFVWSMRISDWMVVSPVDLIILSSRVSLSLLVDGRGARSTGKMTAL